MSKVHTKTNILKRYLKDEVFQKNELNPVKEKMRKSREMTICMIALNF